VVTVAGIREHAQALREDLATVLAPVGLRLADAKTRVVHLDEGFDFLGFRIQRKRRRGSQRRYAYPTRPRWP
jgi:RNA-directed DNA polymerase